MTLYPFGPAGTALPGLGPQFMAFSAAGTHTLFGQPAGFSSLTVDSAVYTFGVQFSLSSSGTLDAIWFYSPAGAGVLPGTIGLYQVTGGGTGTLVHSEAASWSGAAGSGWVKATFSSPPSLTAGISYKGVCLGGDSVNNWYGSIANYWSTGAGASGISSGPLSAPNNAGGDGGQDTYNLGSSLTYPATSFNATNYGIDVEVTA